MANKKAIAAGVLVGIIAMLITFIILFRLDLYLANMLTSGAEDQVCFLSASFSSVTKVGPKTVKELNCDRDIIRVMMNSNDIPAAEREKGVEFVYINKQIAPKLRENLADWYGEPESNFDINKNKDRVLRYRLNEIMAKELKRCWGNLGRGTYDLFDENLLRGNSKICFICSTVRFESSVKNKFEGQEIDLKPFLVKNPVKLATPEAISYYEFLDDDIALYGDLLRPEYKYTTDRIYAVVFLRLNLRSYIGGTVRRLATLRLSEILSDRDYVGDTALAVDVPLIMPLGEVSDNCDDFA